MKTAIVLIMRRINVKKVDIVVKELYSDIVEKNILEVACGCAEFSISASHYAESINCIDIDDSRLNGSLPENVKFDMMDASRMNYSDESFDTIVLYNAFYHIYSQWEEIKRECMRVLKSFGTIYIVSSWNLDISLMNEVFEGSVKKNIEFSIVKIIKGH